MPHSRRRLIALSAAALMAVTGLTAGAATANAQPTDTSKCETSQKVERSWGGSLGTKYYIEKEVVGDGTAAPGGEVTFRTTVSGAGALVREIVDYHPAGFELVRARESVWKVLGGQTWSNVTDDVRRNATNNSVTRASSGWTTAGGAYSTLETTYKVPNNVSPGDVLNTGAGTDIVLIDGGWTVNPINTCVTIREPNAAEAVTGSLDGLGLGSVTSGSTAAGGISSDPAAFSSDIINGLDLAKIIGLS